MRPHAPSQRKAASVGFMVPVPWQANHLFVCMLYIIDRVFHEMIVTYEMPPPRDLSTVPRKALDQLNKLRITAIDCPIFSQWNGATDRVRYPRRAIEHGFQQDKPETFVRAVHQIAIGF